MTSDVRAAPMIGIVGLTGQSVFLRTAHLPREGETVLCDALRLESGGKGHNQAITCARMGAKAIFMGAVGDDAWGEDCRQALEESGVAPLLTVFPGKKSAFAAISVDQTGHNQVSCYTGAGMLLRPSDIAGSAQLGNCNLLLTQLEIPDECVAEVLRMGRQCGIPVILNPAPARPLPMALLAGFDVLTPNEHEAKALFGVGTDEGEDGEQSLVERITALGLRRVVVTLGGKGALVVEAGRAQRIPRLPVKHVVDTTGAGDIFNGALATRLAEGASLLDAARFAVAASGLGVCKQGAAGSIPTRAQVDACYYDEEKGQWTTAGADICDGGCACGADDL